MTNGYISPDKLTDQEKQVIEILVEKFYKSDEIETVSAARTEKIIETAKSFDFDDAGAARLAKHFNASSVIVSKMKPAEKADVYKKIEERFGPKA